MSWKPNFISIDTAIDVIKAVSDATCMMSNPAIARKHVLVKALIEHGDKEVLTKACMRVLYRHPWTAISILGQLYRDEGPEIPEDARGRIGPLVSIWLAWCQSKLGDKIWEG